MLTQEDRSQLTNIELFRGLTVDETELLCAELQHKTFPAASQILTTNQPGSAVYFLVRGTVKVTIDHDGREAVLNIVGPGEVLGELSLVDGLGHSANVVTLEEAWVLWMNRDAFQNRLLTMPRLTYNVALILSRRLRLATSRIEMLTTLDVPGRVAHQLLALSNAYGQPQDDGSIRIPMHLTQGELATLVCATRARVNQVLKDLRRRDIVSVDDAHHITIHNRTVLAKRCV